MTIRSVLLTTAVITIASALAPVTSQAGQRYLSQSVVELSGIPAPSKAKAAPMSAAAAKTRVDLVRAGAVLTERVDVPADPAPVAVVEPEETVAVAEPVAMEESVVAEETLTAEIEPVEDVAPEPASAPVEVAAVQSDRPVVEPGALDDVVVPEDVARDVLTDEEIEQAERQERNSLRLKARAERQEEVTAASRDDS